MPVIAPVASDFVAWLKLQSTPSSQSLDHYTEAFNCAIEAVLVRIDLPAGDFPARVREAIFLVASRLAKRVESPEGTAGFNGFVQQIVRDPDVDLLLGRLLKVTGFY